MRRWLSGLLVGTAVGASAGVVAAAGCASGGESGAAASEGGSGQGGSAATGTNTGIAGAGGAISFDGGDSGLDPDSACALFTKEAKHSPAAMLIVLDASASMTTMQKWNNAQIAIVGAIDKDVFDTMSIGLVRFPASFSDPPQCVCNYYGLDYQTCKMLIAPGVSCGISGLPQIAISPAGTLKSNDSTGVRKQIYDHLAIPPLSNQDDGSPIYDALSAGYGALKLYDIDKRILVLITDGGFSCTSLSARPGYSDDYGCADWEYPASVNDLITSNRTDAAKPVFTFVVGVPGSDSNGAMQGSFATPPYKMRLALSTYAVSGSPDTVDPACDKGAVFTQGGAEPAVPCHIDLSNGASFNPDALASAIEEIRGKALGCVYDLPTPEPGQTIDPGYVNVLVTLEGVAAKLPKRSDPLDTCDLDGCWDYSATGQVEILGKTCADIGKAVDAKVDIMVGCKTELK